GRAHLCFGAVAGAEGGRTRRTGLRQGDRRPSDRRARRCCGDRPECLPVLCGREPWNMPCRRSGPCRDSGGSRSVRGPAGDLRAACRPSGMTDRPDRASRDGAAGVAIATILLATDLTARCEPATERAVELARLWNADLHVLTVLSPTLLMDDDEDSDKAL